MADGCTALSDFLWEKVCDKQKKPYACLNSETGKPYDFSLFCLSARDMIAQLPGEVNDVQT